MSDGCCLKYGLRKEKYGGGCDDMWWALQGFDCGLHEDEFLNVEVQADVFPTI